MKKKYTSHTRNKRKAITSASRMLNNQMSLEDFANRRVMLESTLRDSFSKIEYENNKDKQVVFY